MKTNKKQILVLKLNQTSQQQVNHNKHPKMDSQRNRLATELQQAYEKIKKLQLINTELTRTIQSSQLPEYKNLLSRLSKHEQTSSQTIASLQIRISNLETQLAFQQQRYSTIVSELQQNLQESEALMTQLKQSLQTVSYQNGILKKEIHGQRTMIRNQEHLIDDYKKSIEEEKQIQREIAKCQLIQIQNQLQKQMQQKLQHIKQQHQKKLTKMHQQNLTHSYKSQINNLKQFITAKKTLIDQNYSDENRPFIVEESLSSKKLALTEQKPQQNSKLHENKTNHHILIFDESDSSSNRHKCGVYHGQDQKENSNRKSNNWTGKEQVVNNCSRKGKVVDEIKSLESTLESGISNFKSIEMMEGKRAKKQERLENFKSLNVNK